MNKYVSKNKILVGVYGSLRKGLHNHSVLKNSKLIGTFWSIPVFNLYSLTHYPALRLGGNMSILFEVYEVNEEVLDDLDHLEGYHSYSNVNNLYNRVRINSPYGEIQTYEYNGVLSEDKKCKTGDWVEEITTKRLTT